MKKNVHKHITREDLLLNRWLVLQRCFNRWLAWRSGKKCLLEFGSYSLTEQDFSPILMKVMYGITYEVLFITGNQLHHFLKPSARDIKKTHNHSFLTTYCCLVCSFTQWKQACLCISLITTFFSEHLGILMAMKCAWYSDYRYQLIRNVTPFWGAFLGNSIAKVVPK